ncbi:type II toxin-antitoxin system RelE/ParE family toxin [Asticcacaulis excentricus]|uniref:Plasmid stabilization system n=1 Tax=Asticcacaulis excentricus (strain ATCC 15261 / DSM 4724 / KCTC 12464 / NCIMB 9791 / VKM B-1370 / CB 48) TaxID=573065 RepID=E8RV14_ASTEC|nr:type II toxin-antitoxin system RelE/ParE family toxin [Asticcacaulis excentricus]ADU14214.1 plasmid stabilization system [Asticcacaulis excentricus CB 48]
MTPKAVIFTPEALQDISDIYDWISSQGGAAIAASYLTRLESYCLCFDLLPERGSLRHDLRKGLRVTSFERRITLTSVVTQTEVIFVRLFRRGRDWEALVRTETD